MGEKWWFAFDSKCVLDNDEDKLTKYSFSQLNEFYEEKVKKLCPKSTKKCVEVLEARNQIAFIIIKLKYISQKIENIAINKINLKIKYEYIDSLREYMENIWTDNEQLKKVKKMLENIKILGEVYNLKEDEILNLNILKILEKIEVIIS